MKEVFDDLPGWTFQIEEVSMNVYKVEGWHSKLGYKVSGVGVDVEELIQKCKMQAIDLEQGINNKHCDYQ